MLKLNWFELYLLNIIKNNNFLYINIPTGIGKTNIISHYAKSLPDKKIGIICLKVIFENYNQYEKK